MGVTHSVSSLAVQAAVAAPKDGAETASRNSKAIAVEARAYSGGAGGKLGGGSHLLCGLLPQTSLLACTHGWQGRIMTRGVFLHREDSIYNDRPAEQYQFPSQYLSRASQFIGDWIIYYEPRRGPTAKGYYAIARVESIIPDPTAVGMYLALIEPNSYLPFERPVPFSGPGGPVERGVLNEAGKISGRAQAAVRPISIEDFNRIIDLGLQDEVLAAAHWPSA